MFKLLRMGKGLLALIIIIPLMTIVSFVIYMEYIETKEDVSKMLKEHLINEKLELFENYSRLMIQDFGANIQTTLATNQELCEPYEDKLRLIVGKEIKYLYLLHKDAKGNFRFLLDATVDINEKAEFNQRFQPQTDIWSKGYETGTVQIVHQKDLDQLWVSVAYPILLDDKVIAILGADFTYDVYTNILNTLNPVESLYKYVSIFMSIMLFLAYILVYLYYKTRKKGFIDPLTQVYNRQYLNEFLEVSSLKDYHIMMIDLDYFKQVNDTYGHDAGDDVLRIITQKIKNLIRKEDVLIRFGGEEFLLLVYKQEIVDSIEIANRIRKTIMNNTIHTNNNQISMTLSIGINPYPYRAKNIEEAIKISDEQLYIAKSSGRNRVEIFQDNELSYCPMSKRISDVQEAIDEERIKCAFQAIYSALTHEIQKYELLIRLIDKKGEVIGPNDFLPSIRNTQVYINLTRIVLDKAIEVLQENDFSLSINLDIQDILNEDLMGLLEEKMKNNFDIAKRLTIEILEHEEITNFKAIKKNLDLLKAMGLTLALDDFGSGYANFSYLTKLDIDILKIDGSLIHNIQKDTSAYYMLKAIVDFSQSMQMQTVVEQVETKEELEVVESLGVDYVQGYFLGRPEFLFD